MLCKNCQMKHYVKLELIYEITKLICDVYLKMNFKSKRPKSSFKAFSSFASACEDGAHGNDDFRFDSN